MTTDERRYRALVRRGYQRRWEVAAQDLWPGGDDPAFDRLARYFARHPEGEPRVDRVLDAFFASPDPFVRKARWSPNLLARDPGRWLADASSDDGIASGHRDGVRAMAAAAKREADPGIVPGEPSATLVELARAELLDAYGERDVRDEDAIDELARECARRAIGPAAAARWVIERALEEDPEAAWASIAASAVRLLRIPPRGVAKVAGGEVRAASGGGA